MIVLAFVLNSLFPPNTSERDKIEILAPYFSPPIGAKVVITRKEMMKKRKTPLLSKGYIWVTPPKGSCFIITRHKEFPDINVCKKQKLSFFLKDLGPGGELKWRVIQGPKDPGTDIIWKSDYRIANYAPLGEFESGNNQSIPIYSCQASGSGNNRKIVLQLFDGRKWFISFPNEDIIVKKRKEKPNLFLRVMTTAKDGQAESKDLSTDANGKPKITKEDVKRKHSMLSLKLSGRYKEKKEKKYEFITSPYNS